MKTLIIGAGPLGSLYAYLFYKACKDVTIFARNEHYKFLKKNGIVLINEFTQEKIVEKVNENNTLVGFSNQNNKLFSDFYFLSERETDVLYFLIKGLSLQIIGEKLFISTGTVKNHVLKIYKKNGYVLNLNRKLEESNKSPYIKTLGSIDKPNSREPETNFKNSTFIEKSWLRLMYKLFVKNRVG